MTGADCRLNSILLWLMPDYFILVRGGPWVSKELKTYFGRLMNSSVRMEVFIRNWFAYPALEPDFSRHTALHIRWNSRVGRIFLDIFTSLRSFHSQPCLKTSIRSHSQLFELIGHDRKSELMTSAFSVACVQIYLKHDIE